MCRTSERIRMSENFVYTLVPQAKIKTVITFTKPFSIYDYHSVCCWFFCTARRSWWVERLHNGWHWSIFWWKWTSAVLKFLSFILKTRKIVQLTQTNLVNVTKGHVQTQIAFVPACKIIIVDIGLLFKHNNSHFGAVSLSCPSSAKWRFRYWIGVHTIWYSVNMILDKLLLL